MKQELKDYTKSVIANKFTLTGYLGMCITTGIVFYIQDETFPTRIYEIVAFGLSCIPVLGSAFGLETYETYRKTKKHIKENKKIKIGFKSRHSRYYCRRIGMKLAAKESGLEDLI